MSLSTCPTPPRRQEAGAEEPTALTSQPTAAFLLTEMKTLKHWVDLAFMICLERGRVDAKHRSTLLFSVPLKLTEDRRKNLLFLPVISASGSRL